MDSYMAAMDKFGYYNVRLSLRARNAFNALRYAEYDCAVKNDNDNWTLVNLRQISP